MKFTQGDFILLNLCETADGRLSLTGQAVLLIMKVKEPLTRSSFTFISDLTYFCVHINA